ncbi:hypothetical protein [Parabacteroides sp. PF5-9]|uniref:hypothetical protein n=1 Tax=Parabacteroides sp. PF5-9 TaxID=1742404 RepID=UPI002474D751|nr:hypothetical protein [Parabacteroides sp. PF5-9]MDH6357569.1 hypothetical protein [Parabacteroides sp. PF5-9]
MERKTFLKTTGLLIAGGLMGKTRATERYLADEVMSNGSTIPATSDYLMMDLHVHRSNKQTIEDIVAKSEKTGIRFGVMQNIAPWGMKSDADLKAYIDELKPYPVYIGLQPMMPGWSKNFSPELIAQADYVAMDPQVVSNGNGYNETINVWEYASYIDDPETFMGRNMQHYMTILTGDDPINIFACPLFLPASIEREYHKLWTKKRLQQIIDAARARNIAIEINDLVRVPHEEFILMAKRAGLKFTFGSDTRDEKTGRLDYCKYIAQKCQLTQKDFYIPEREI